MGMLEGVYGNRADLRQMSVEAKISDLTPVAPKQDGWTSQIGLLV